MYIDYQYDYWGANGRSSERSVEEFSSLDEAISKLGEIAFYTAINEAITINKILDGEEGDLSKIQDGINAVVNKKRNDLRIETLKYAISSHTRFLENVDNEITERRQALVTLNNELKELESQ